MTRVKFFQFHTLNNKDWKYEDSMPDKKDSRPEKYNVMNVWLINGTYYTSYGMILHPSIDMDKKCRKIMICRVVNNS